MAKVIDAESSRAKKSDSRVGSKAAAKREIKLLERKLELAKRFHKDFSDHIEKMERWLSLLKR